MQSKEKKKKGDRTREGGGGEAKKKKKKKSKQALHITIERNHPTDKPKFQRYTFNMFVSGIWHLRVDKLTPITRRTQRVVSKRLHGEVSIARLASPYHHYRVETSEHSPARHCKVSQGTTTARHCKVNQGTTSSRYCHVSQGTTARHCKVSQGTTTAWHCKVSQLRHPLFSHKGQSVLQRDTAILVRRLLRRDIASLVWGLLQWDDARLVSPLYWHNGQSVLWRG